MQITILGEPASKANSRRLVKIKNRPASIKSAKALDYADRAGWQLKQQRLKPIDGDVSVTIRIYYRTRRPDLDESVILDVLQGHAYHNDRQVREKHIYWGLDKENPRAEITLNPLTSPPGVVE